MERVNIKDESSFLLALQSGICCIAKNGARHVVNQAAVGSRETGETIFVVETLAGNLSFEKEITLFIFREAKEAQRFLNFERCEFDEDKILSAEIIGEL